MRNAVLTISAILLLVFGGIQASGAGKQNGFDKNSLFIRCELSESSFYCNQAVTAVIWLYSKDGEISSAEALENPAVERADMTTLSRIDIDVRPRRERIKDEVYLAYPVAAYVLSMKDAGKNKFKPGVFRVGVNVPVVYNDPFYGRIRGVETRTFDVAAEPVSFKVKPLPACDNGESFSGCVGNFSVETVIPKGRIIVNEEATALVVLKGRGIIGNDILPEYREAFGNGTRLKSVSDRTETYFDGEGIYSEKVLECEFIPERRDNCVIGKVRFGYFNPQTERYEMAESEPVELKVDSSTIMREKLEI